MKTLTKYTVPIFLFLSIFSLFCFSDVNKDNYYVKVPEFPTSPKIDGKLENPLWEKGAILDTFTQYEPQEGASPSEKTVAYIGYDKKNLYIAVYCFDSNPKAIRASLTKRDEIYGDDEVTIYLDSFNDKKRAFVFQVNPCGVQADGIYTETRRRGRGRGGGGFFGFDRNWDTFFLSNAHKDDSGYTVEMAIPFKSIRFPNTRSQAWGLQIMRTIRRKNEEIYWYPRSRDINGFLVQTGTLEIDGIIDKGKNFEMMPVFTGLKQDDEKLDPEAGINLKYGITSDLTADITYNPDFSQIEADMPQNDVNQRYALYYPEKRPFFLEGKDFYDTPFELVYTRKIVDPQWGVKLSGKVGKTTIGFLSAYDINPPNIDIPSYSEEEDVDDDVDNPYRSMINVFRLKRDLFPESHIGFIVTDKEMGYSWKSLTNNYNRVAGIDGHFKFKNYYRFSFQILSSLSRFGKEKTDFVPALNFSLSRNARHLQFSASWRSIHPDFEASSGFFRRKDIHHFNSRISYAFLPQNDWIISVRPSFEYRRIYDFDNTLTDEDIQFSCFVNGWRQSLVWTTFSSELERYEGINFHKKTFRATFRSEPFSWLSGNFSFSFGDSIYYDENPYLGYKTSCGIMATLKPLTNLRLFYNLKKDKFFKEKGGEKEYEVNILSQRINYQLSRYLTFRLITDYNDYHKKLYNSILLSYEYIPGTVFYLGIDDNQGKDDAGIFRSEGRYYFIKFSYWWRI